MFILYCYAISISIQRHSISYLWTSVLLNAPTELSSQNQNDTTPGVDCVRHKFNEQSTNWYFYTFGPESFSIRETAALNTCIFVAALNCAGCQRISPSEQWTSQIWDQFFFIRQGAIYATVKSFSVGVIWMSKEFKSITLKKAESSRFI